MKFFRPDETPDAGRNIQRGYLALASLQCAAALASLWEARSEGGMLGLSGARLMLAGFFAVALLACIGLLVETWLRPERTDRRWQGLVARLTQPRAWWRLFLACIAIFTSGVLFLALAPGFTEPVAIAYAERLAPLVGLITGLAAQTAAAMLIYRRSVGLFGALAAPRLFYTVMLALIAVLVAWSWAMRGIGQIEAVHVGWNRLGAPLIEFQVFLAWAASLGWIALGALLARRGSGQPHKRRWFLSPDLWLSILIWALAVVAWQSTPVEPNWFLMRPFPPNFETYPSSDARAYDTAAQSALVGNGYIFYGLPYIRRSLLAFYMTLLHLLGGQDYNQVILFQILALALIPVILYHLARRMHSRAAGILVSALVIFREANSIRVSGNITTSNAKLLMADMPTVLFTSLFVLLLLAWLKRLQAPTAQADTRLSALLCGGGLGLVMLIRLESFVFIFATALVAACVLWPRRQWGTWAQQMLIFGLGICLVLSPWVTRNYLRTGKIFIDSPNFRQELLFQRFNRQTTPVPPEQEPEEPSTLQLPTPALPAWKPGLAQQPAQPTPTPSTQDESGEAEAMSLGYFWEDAVPIAKSAAAHFLNSQVQLLLIVPTNCRIFESALAFTAHRSPQRLWAECCQPNSYLRTLPYWGEWDGSFSFASIWLLLINLAILAWGVQTAWRRHRWVGVTPLILTVIYLAANSLFRNSGGRYILPVDWSALLYFGIGLTQLTQDGLAKLFAQAALQPTASEGLAAEPLPAEDVPAIRPHGWRRNAPVVLLGLALIVIGSLPPALEMSFPQRYPIERIKQMEQLLFNSDKLPAWERNELLWFIKKGAKISAGRALYPRFFAPDVEDPNGQGELFEATSYPRITFYLAGAVNDNLTMPVERRPKKFANATDVLVIHCPDLDSLVIALYAPDGALQDVLLRSPFPPGRTCPLSETTGAQP